MKNRLLVATRKGLFTVDRTNGAGGSRWAITRTAFLGIPVPMVLPDPRDGAVYAALDHGHFGAKLHRSRDGGSWEEVATPVYPKPEPGEEDRDPVRGTLIPWRL